MHPSNRRADGARINRRKNRHGTFWEDGYPSRLSLHQCVVYIDLNMVRAGMVKHPRAREHSGYREIHKPPSRYLSDTFAAHCRSLSNPSGVSKFDLQGLMH